jgi:flagellar hook assembly protein FlgD
MSYPNPFSASTNLRYRLSSSQNVELDVLDVAGRVVATLASGVQSAGIHEVKWNASNARGRLPSGLYLVRIRLGPETFTHKVVVSQ